MATTNKAKKVKATPTIDEVIEQTQEFSIVEGTVIPNLLNVRERPAPSAQILKTIARDEKVKINKEQSTENYYALVDGGWVVKTFIQLD